MPTACGVFRKEFGSLNKTNIEFTIVVADVSSNERKIEIIKLYGASGQTSFSIWYKNVVNKCINLTNYD